MSPTQRTLKRCREIGGLADVSEKWVAFPPPGHRVDLFGFIDVLWITPGGIVGIQATTATNMSHRVAKIKTECEEAAAAWSKFAAIEVWGWKKYKKAEDGKFWRVRIERVEL